MGVGPRGTLPLHEPTPVLVVLLDLSLTPPCPRIITGCEPWQAAAMAIGLDLLIVAGTRAYKLVARFANPALTVALLWPQRLAFLAATTVLWMAVVAPSLAPAYRRWPTPARRRGRLSRSKVGGRHDDREPPQARPRRNGQLGPPLTCPCGKRASPGSAGTAMRLGRTGPHY